jgi:hypothetical protein
MSEYTNSLRLDQNEVTDIADAYLGYARYLANPEDQSPDPTETAGCYLISAVYRSLIDPVGSREVWEEATKYYFGADYTYGKITAVCSMNIRLVEDSLQLKINDSSPEAQFADILAHQYLASWQGELYRPETNISVQGGQLNIPLRNYINAFAAIRETDGYFVGEKTYRALAPVRDLLNRAAELPQQLMTDSYHWDNLYGTFIPFEPEILAACICIGAYTQRMSWSLDNLISSIGEGLTVIPLWIAKEMVLQS